MTTNIRYGKMEHVSCGCMKSDGIVVWRCPSHYRMWLLNLDLKRS